MAETATRQTRDTVAPLRLLSCRSQCPLPRLRMLMHPCLDSSPMLPAETRPERRELASMIDDYPSCKRLMEAYRRVYHMPNKTPLSILFEYASRLNLQVPFPILTPCQRFLAPFLPPIPPCFIYWPACL